MRVLKKEILEDRKRKLLQAVVYHYVRTAKPVGSQVLVDEYDFGLSSATVRNLLLDLENEGYIQQPHTSAGRVPTDKGYRLYVDSLLEVQSLAAAEEEKIRKEYKARTKELEDLMVSTSHMLSRLSHHTGLVLSPRLDKTLLRRLQLISLGGNQVLVVVISQTGSIRHRVVTLKQPIDAARLETISDTLNQRLKNKPLSDVRTQILSHIEAIHREQEEILHLTEELAREAFDLQHVEPDLYVNGRENMVSLPDFENYGQLTNLMKVVEEKNLLMSAMEDVMKKEGISVQIGTEHARPELHGISLVSSTYKLGDRTLGVLGILGPRRMEYGRMMSLVDGVSRVMNQLLDRINKEYSADE